MEVKLSVILPAYLEEENLRLLLPRIHKECARVAGNYEILVVDTQRPMDGTFNVCQSEFTRYINRENGNTYGDAVRTGIKHSRGERVLFMDADGSHPPFVIGELLKEKDQYDLVIASRYVKGGYTENTRILVFMSLMVNLGYRLVLGIKCKDVSNSFKLYRGEQLRALELKCNNFDIVEEILYKIFKQYPNTKFKEVPFTFRKRMFGKTKRNLFVFIFTYIVTLIRLRLM